MWRKAHLFALAICSIGLLGAAGCGGDGGFGSGTGGRGTVQVFIAEPQSTTFEQVELDISRLEAKRGTIWETILPGTRTVQLMGGLNNPTLFVTANLPTGNYRAVRMLVTRAMVTDEDGPHSASVGTIPSTVLTSFDIHVGESTPVTIAFDLSQSISQNADGTFRFDPVFSVSP